MRSNFKSKFFIFILLLGAIFFVLFLFRKSPSKPLEGIAHTSLSPVQRFFSLSGAWFGEKFSFIGAISQLKTNNENLSEENLTLKSQLAQLKDIEGENEKLREELQLAPRDKFNLQAATVIGKDPNNQADYIYIDRGSKEGISENMAVVVGEGVLIGRVTKVYANDAAVELILNRDSRINVEIEESGEKGIVRGEYGTSVVLDMISQAVELKSGDTVITSGLGNTLPRGLLVGYIKEAVPTADQLFQRASIVLPVQPNKLRVVWVIKS